MLKTMRLRHRIFLGYAVMVFLFIVATGVTLRSVNIMEQAYEERGQTYATRLAATDLKAEAFKLQVAARGYLLVKSDEFLKRWEDADREVRATIQTLERVVTDQRTRTAWTGLLGVIRQAQDLYESEIHDVKTDQVEKALERMKAVGVRIGGDLEVQFSAFDKLLEERFNQATETAGQARSNAYIALIGSGFVVAVLSIALSMWILSSANRSVGQATSVVSASAKEIAATVAQHERTAVTQSAMVNETATTIEELNASLQQSAEGAGAAVEVAQRASTMTGEGRTIVGEAIQGMTNLKDKVGSVADQILRLGEQTGQIGNIANVVKDLATQTNMLALNAAVEATRAGEHGKGFAVVASEVRKLADQSKKSAEEAYRIVSEIQKASNSTIMVTEESIKTVDEVARIARKVGELFDGLSMEAARVYESAQQVVLNARQQTSAIGQIGEAMSNINASSRETAAGITQTKLGLQSLEEAARNLQASI